MTRTDLTAYQSRIDAVRTATGKSVSVGVTVWYHVNIFGGETPTPAVEWQVASFHRETDKVHLEYAGTLDAALTATETYHAVIEPGVVVTP